MPANPPKTAATIQVETFPDCQIITPPNRLRTAVRRLSNNHEDPVARAEKALAGLSDQFDEWMRHECERLTNAFGIVASGKFSTAERAEFYHAAHDIKGDAATFGYPAASEIAESLCRLLEQMSDLTGKTGKLLNHHVNAIEAVVRENKRRRLTAKADELSWRLRGTTAQHIAANGEDRQVQAINVRQSPSIAPGKKS